MRALRSIAALLIVGGGASLDSFGEVALVASRAVAQVAGPVNPTVPTTPSKDDAKIVVPGPDAAPPMPGLKRLAVDTAVWVDPVKKRVVLEGEIVLRRGPLELLACLKQTKEHEAIIACDTRAYVVHAALLAVGAKTGNPASFQPEFVPARGTEIDITIEWTDAQGKKQQTDARKWLRNAKTGKSLEYPWVFGGSGFWKDPMTGKNFYQAEDGDFICVSNFPTAMLDLPVESPQANAALMFEAFTDLIPPEKTKVLLILTPKLAKDAPAGKPEAKAEQTGAKPTTTAAPASVTETTGTTITIAETPVVKTPPTAQPRVNNARPTNPMVRRPLRRLIRP